MITNFISSRLSSKHFVMHIWGNLNTYCRKHKTSVMCGSYMPHGIMNTLVAVMFMEFPCLINQAKICLLLIKHWRQTFGLGAYPAHLKVLTIQFYKLSFEHEFRWTEQCMLNSIHIIQLCIKSWKKAVCNTGPPSWTMQDNSLSIQFTNQFTLFSHN